MNVFSYQILPFMHDSFLKLYNIAIHVIISTCVCFHFNAIENMFAVKGSFENYLKTVNYKRNCEWKKMCDNDGNC